MGIGDIAVSLWGECEAQDGMHFSGRGFVHVELIDPETGAPRPFEDGAEGELVYTHLRQPRGAAAALPQPRPRAGARRPLRLRPHRAAGALHRPHRRHADRARGQPVPDRGARGGGGASRRRSAASSRSGRGGAGVKQAPPLPVVVELARGPGGASRSWPRRSASGCASGWWSRTEVELVPWASLPRSDYKSKLVDWSRAET